MGAIVVVELDVFLHRYAEFFLCFIIITTEIFLLDRGEKGFGNSVIMRRAWSGERLGDTKFFEKVAKFK